ncbi:unnamed protein product [Caenorhabditis bovis]|uniref:Arrestin C-terminal-like domain-containing protein n=1 Tax=Caenorhabditis bovis TaxID=2654633 RepID=A0A8S1FG52_9PELO|nr:unnamed protein product [Caenorhabditis bovis]
MGADVELEVVLENKTEVFVPGYPITGVVYFKTDETYKARAVKLEIVGKAETNWTESESYYIRDSDGTSRRRSRTITYKAEVLYMDHEALLWTSSDGENKMPPGSYQWPFSINLPPNCPPSFEGEYGYIRYYLRAEIDRPWRLDKAKKQCFTVSPQIDLNLTPEARNVLRDSCSENIGSCCFKKGYVELRIEVPKSGYVPGEIIPINMQFNNTSSVPITKAEVEIYQRTRFSAVRDGTTIRFNGLPNDTSFSMCDVKEKSKEVAKVSKQIDVQPGFSDNLTLEIKLAPVVPTINQYSPIILVEYYLVARVDTAATFGSEAESEVQLLIGTIPIRDYLPPSFYPADPSAVVIPPYSVDETNGISTIPQPAPALSPPYPVNADNGFPKGSPIPSAPPISYEDSVYGTDGTTLNVDDNSKPFAPKYPVYNGLPTYNPTAPPAEK